MDFPADLIGGEPSAAQRAAWDALDRRGREETRARLEAIHSFESDNGGLSAAEAADRLGIKLSRFYKMASDWRRTGDLQVLGTIRARQGKRRSKLDAEVVNALQAVVARVVARNEDASVSELTRIMLAESGVLEWKPERNIPSRMKLREIVEAELRRSAAMLEAGNQIAFDCCALVWAHSPTDPYCLFLVIDRGTRAILGCHLGLFGEGLSGYAAAASNAMAQTAKLELPWARDMLGMQMVVGARREPFERLCRQLEKEFAVSAKLASTKRRFGRYALELLGPRLGQVVFAPKATGFDQDIETGLEVDAAMTKVNGKVDVRSREWVSATVNRAIEEHNDLEVAGLVSRLAQHTSRPPARMMDVLRYIVEAGS